MPRTVKKYILLMLLALIAVCFALGNPGLGFAWSGLLLAWLFFEHHERTRFRLLRGSPLPERSWALPGALHGVQAWPHHSQALAIEHGPRLTQLRGPRGPLGWSRSFEQRPMAATLLPDGRLLWASEDRLHWTDAQGVDQGSLGFEPPLYRQGYSLFFSPDGSTGFLHTPWFIQAFDAAGKALGGRIRYEDAGHYLKYAASAPDGRGLLLAGALLLDEAESGGAGIEARWDYWGLNAEGQWQRVWAQACESYTNTHLRGVALSADGSLACAEVFREGYQWRLYSPDGAELWQRAGERPVLAPNGLSLAWEDPTQGLVLGLVQGQQVLGAHQPRELIRAKSIQPDGSLWVVEGTRLLRLNAQASPVFEADFAQEVDDLSFGPGFLALSTGGRAALISLEARG